MERNFNIPLSTEQTNKLSNLIDLTLEKNKVMNLTAIRDKDEFFTKMIWDSLQPINYFDFSNKKVIDVGTGGGFPGLPLAIVCENTSFDLLDSTEKKITHIREVCNTLNLENVNGITDRIENFAKTHREKYDVVVCRAVAPLYILVELCVPLLKVGGHLLALKGSSFEEEILDSKSALIKLNSKVKETYQYNWPYEDSKLGIIDIVKEKESHGKYPRDYSIIKTKHL